MTLVLELWNIFVCWCSCTDMVLGDLRYIVNYCIVSCINSFVYNPMYLSIYWLLYICFLNSVLEMSSRNSSSVNKVNISCTSGGKDLTSSSPFTNVVLSLIIKRWRVFEHWACYQQSKLMCKPLGITYLVSVPCSSLPPTIKCTPLSFISNNEAIIFSWLP